MTGDFNEHPMPKEKNYYTTGEVARLLNVSQMTVWNAIKKKVLRAGRTHGGHYRISRESLDDYRRRFQLTDETPGSDKWRILIVDDEPTVLRMLRRSLEFDPSLEIKTTDSGYEAGFLTKSFKPDLILLDIFLKDLDGRRVARQIRSDEELKGTKIVAVTGARDPKDLKEIKQAGVDDIIEKPITPTELRARVGRILHHEVGGGRKVKKRQ